ncbi:MAG TPA: flagellar biosynthesis protein FlhF [Burkholderiaceae bacterium]|jgi:flagellar biosynthesis protein FlhF|nr:flagellar biosynthesis protein FlhF [Burkholderiaceae bacterium]
MNVQRFTGRTSRDAMIKVRQAFGEDAVVLSTKPCPGGVEMLAMPPDSMASIERMAQPAPEAPRARAAAPNAAPRDLRKSASPALTPAGAEAPVSGVEQDVRELSMSTLSFQDYVRERLLKKRQAAIKGETPEPASAAPAPVRNALRAGAVADSFDALEARMSQRTAAKAREEQEEEAGLRRDLQREERRAASRELPREEFDAPAARRAARETRHEDIALAPAAPVRERSTADQLAMMSELRSMKGLIEERFGALAFMEKLQRQPAQARLTQKLLDCGFSPALIRKLGEGLPADVSDEQAWVAGVLEHNLATGEGEPAIEDQGGVFAMVGSTGVGKTTSTAKLAAAFATRHGASQLGLVTLDAYRLGAHEQLRAYGRILGVPVHTAHDRTALEDLLDLLSGKKLVLIDTAGTAQRDSRTRELLDMLGHRSINKVLVVNAASQGETIEDVLVSYRAAACKGMVLTKLDEAVKLAPALDAAIRHRMKVLAVANGQRVPEDWHRLSGHALVHRALRAGGSPAYRHDASDMNLVFAAPQSASRSAARASAQ